MWTETVSWIQIWLYMCMNHMCPSSSYVSTVKKLQSYNDQTSQEMWCDIRYVNLCEFVFVPSWLFVFVEVCEYPLGNLDRQLVCLECWIIIICVVSMTVKFEGTEIGIPWSDESLAVLSSWGQFNLGRRHASTAWVEAALSTPWIIGTALWSWLLAFVSRERGVLLS